MSDAKEPKEFSATERGVLKAKEFLVTANAGETELYIAVRIVVTGGGCSGLQYKFNFEKKATEGDRTFEEHGLQFFIDPKTLDYVKGGAFDYDDGGLSGKSGFAIVNNPNSTGGCGCGKSFSA